MRRLVLPLLLASLAAALLAGQGRPSPLLKVEDFGTYWAAARLNLEGRDPYDPDALLALQRTIEPERAEAQPVYGTPAALALTTPLALLDFAAARWAWLAVQVGALLAAVELLWRRYGGAPEGRGLAWALAFAFYPTLHLLALGQLSTWTLLGVAGFVALEGRGRPFAAGACAGLAVVKPQTVLLFGAALLLRSLDRRRWAALAGAAATSVRLTLAAAALNPAVLGQYRAAMTARPPSGVAPMPGSVLRHLLGVEALWPTFVPTLLGLAWLAWHYRRRRRDWSWPRELPLLLAAGLMAAPYGWVYDFVLLLPAVLQGAVWAARRGPRVAAVAAAVFVALSAFGVALNVLKVPDFWAVWLPPAVLAAWLVLSRERPP